MQSKNSLLVKYNKLPKWLRWVLFLPVSFIFSIIIWFIMDTAARNVGAYEFVLEIAHPVIVQVIFLSLVFFTVPQGKLKWVKMLIIIRSLFLIFFIVRPILNYLGVNIPYDWTFVKELSGEIITLVASISLFKELKKEQI